MAKIDLQQALNIIKQGEWLKNLRVITCDVKKGSGGSILELGKCRIARNRANSSNTITEQPREQVNKKNPHHNEHFTLNIELANHQIRKIHPILITHINDHELI